MIKNIIKPFFFVVILSFFLVGVNSVLQLKAVEATYYSPASQYGGFYRMEKDSVDVLFLGSSHCYCSFSPQEVYNKFKIRSYNLGSSQQSVWMSYYWLKEALRFQKPKAIVFETFFIWNHSDEASVRKALDYMKWSNVKKEAVKTATQQYPEISSKSFFFTNIRFHERWKEINEDDFGHNNILKKSALKGYAPIRKKYGMLDYKTLQETDEMGVIPSEVEEYLNKIVCLCQENNIIPIFVKTPTTSWSASQHNAVQRYADEKEISFFDFNKEELYSDMKYIFSEDSSDYGHPNIWGAEKISELTGNLLQMNGITSVEDKQWEDTRIYVKNIKKDCALQYEFDIEKYLELIDDERYTIFISARNNKQDTLPHILDKYFVKLGLKYNLIENLPNSYCAVISSDGIQEEADDKRVGLEGMFRGGLSNYSIASEKSDWGNASSIRIDGVEYSLNLGGLNFVVYNNECHEVIDSVCFETGENLLVARKS